MFFMNRLSSKFPTFLGIALLLPIGPASACEGDCIVGITDALIGNYTGPINLVLTQIANAIATQLIPNSKVPATSYLSPIMEEYNLRAYDSMENAIFKSYFHGKCQNAVTGIEPAGCPNPDCPVVCGTPGSIVHHYDKFTSLAFNDTVSLITAIAAPSSPSYRQVKKLVLSASAASNTGQRRLFRFKRSDILGQSDSSEGPEMLMERRDDHVDKTLRSILQRFRSLLTNVCGGTLSAKTNSLPNCNWERAFKEYILTFP